MQDKKQEITQYLKKLRINSMDEGKHALLRLVASCKTFTPTFNDLLRYLEKDIFEYGDSYGWPEFNMDILSNKYGVAAFRDQGARKTYFGFRMPPIKSFSEIPFGVLTYYDIKRVIDKVHGKNSYIQTLMVKTREEVRIKNKNNEPFSVKEYLELAGIDIPPYVEGWGWNRLDDMDISLYICGFNGKDYSLVLPLPERIRSF